MLVTFWGVRGSIPTPLHPDDVSAKAIATAEAVVRAGITDPEQVAQYVRRELPDHQWRTVGGNTACVSVEWPGATVILDAGTGIRALGRKLMNGPCGRGEGSLKLLMTHTHWDHIQGFMFFGPLFQPNQIEILGVHENLRQRFEQQQHADFFPVPLSAFPARLDFRTVKADLPQDLPGGGRFIAKRLNHPGDAFAYRIEHGDEAFVHATDCEFPRNGQGKQQIEEMAGFCRDAELLVFDSQYTWQESLLKEDWGHSTALSGVDIAVRAGVKRLVLFHHEPSYSDEFIHDLLATAADYRDKHYAGSRLEILLAREGLEVGF